MIARDSMQAIRERIWTLLEQSGASPPGAHGRIPDFDGADTAADRLGQLLEWQTAGVVKANPDRAQLPVRQRALHEGKLVFMAVPKLAEIQPFYRLEPRELHQAGLNLDDVAAHQTAARAVPKAQLTELQPVDLIVCGSVAVNHNGVRIGKGAGYAGIEVALLAETGLLAARTTIVTTVHDLQLLGEPLPRNSHDFTVDYIITPSQTIQCPNPHRPTGLDWQHLQPDQLRAIPILRSLRSKRAVMDRLMPFANGGSRRGAPEEL